MSHRRAIHPSSDQQKAPFSPNLAMFRATTTDSPNTDSDSEQDDSPNVEKAAKMELKGAKKNPMNYKQLNEAIKDLKISENSQMKPKPEVKKPKSADKQAQKFIFNISMAVILFAVFAFGYRLIMAYNLSNNKEDILEYPLELFNTRFSELREEEFPNQPDLTFKAINITIADTLDPNNDPAGPGVILLLGTENNFETMSRLETRLSEIIEESFGTEKPAHLVRLDCQKLSVMSLIRAKESLAQSIRDLFSIDANYFMVIENVDKLPPAAVSVLQPYFDHENAPFKKAVYLLTAVTKEPLASKSIKETRRLAVNHFDLVWADYPNEHREAMYSRLFNSVAIVIPEQK